MKEIGLTKKEIERLSPAQKKALERWQLKFHSAVKELAQEIKQGQGLV